MDPTTLPRFSNWVEVYENKEYQGRIPRLALTWMGLEVNGNKLNATRFQMMALRQQLDWEEAE